MYLLRGICLKKRRKDLLAQPLVSFWLGGVIVFLRVGILQRKSGDRFVGSRSCLARRSGGPEVGCEGGADSMLRGGCLISMEVRPNTIGCTRCPTVTVGARFVPGGPLIVVRRSGTVRQEGGCSGGAPRDTNYRSQH